MKYITYNNSFGVEDIRVFSCMEQHKAISKEMAINHSVPFLGVGFIEFHPDGSAECYGHSESMKLDSRGGLDTKLLKRSMEKAVRA